MAKSAFTVIAERHREMGSPGLVYCMQVLGDNFDELDAETANAYEEFYLELEEFAKQQFA